MKKLTSRSYAAVILAVLIIVGTGFYMVKLAINGADWAGFTANENVYTDGVLNTGILTDRNGVILAQAGEDEYLFSESEAVRIACLHVVGDWSGNIGTGALTS